MNQVETPGDAGTLPCAIFVDRCLPTCHRVQQSASSSNSSQLQDPDAHKPGISSLSYYGFCPCPMRLLLSAMSGEQGWGTWYPPVIAGPQTPISPSQYGKWYGVMSTVACPTTDGGLQVPPPPL
ncbi:Hypothetical predicted protein [Podarcis lilfordi]|uniref:Uncharacterized protein n=1 Tax=Podarcis lilfordi TaxID=74358 RepID=A0AA35PQW4_9SAUR|nr:Hypothetical predicted protein [Podarcis lilfordi]